MTKKILVLCVDRDDDLGKKANIDAPVIGEKANLEAAQALALADPSESDVNAIYQAVSTYQELKKGGEEVEVATIVGHRTRGSKADRELAKQLEDILEKGKYTSVVLVSDGADDEQIMPLLQSRIKVEFVKTVIIKQTRELEKSYYVVKEILRDPYFARFIFGVPGLLILIGVISWLMGMEQNAFKFVLLVGGAYLFFRGFGIEDLVSKTFNAFRKTTSIERASFPLYIAAFIVLMLGVWAGFDYNSTSISKSIPVGMEQDNAKLALVYGAGFILGSAGLLTLGIVLFLAGRIGDMYYRKEVHKIKKYARSIVSIVAFAIIVYAGSEFLLFSNEVLANGPTITELFAWVGFSIIITLTGFTVLNYTFIKRYVQPRLKKGLEVRDTKNAKLGEVGHIDFKNRCFYYGEGDDKKRVNFGDVNRIKDAVIIHTEPRTVFP